jgi:flagellar protein FlgJ
MRVIAALLASLLILLDFSSPAVAFEASSVIDASTVLNVRSGPGTDKPVVGTLQDQDAVTVHCKVWGESIAGTQRVSPYWDRIADGQYVADAFIVWTPSPPSVPWCATSEPAGVAVAASGGLNVRSGPGLGNGVVDLLGDGTPVDVACQAWGSSVDGNALWAQIGQARFVSDRYLAWTPDRPWLPWCGQEPVTPAPPSTTAFIAAAVSAAQDSQRSTKVPASVTIAQAILESGWGRSTLTRDDHNYFGMKCFGDPGPVGLGCRQYATHECSSRDCYPTHALFRAYRTAADSYLDHGVQLSTLPRYAEAMKYARDPDRFAREIHAAGYATSPTYADKLIDLMGRYGLYQYDLPENG